MFFIYRYTYDVTKCMFSSGNITEKLRVAKLDCKGETIVDLYAGVCCSEPNIIGGFEKLKSIDIFFIFLHKKHMLWGLI